MLALLLVALSINVTRHRARTKISLGAEADHTLNEVARVFGNCVEYVPIGLPVMAVAEANGAAPVSLYTVGGLLAGGRASHVFGLDAARPVTVARVVGMLLTWAAIGLGALAVLGQARGIIQRPETNSAISAIASSQFWRSVSPEARRGVKP